MQAIEWAKKHETVIPKEDISKFFKLVGSNINSILSHCDMIENAVKPLIKAEGYPVFMVALGIRETHLREMLWYAVLIKDNKTPSNREIRAHSLWGKINNDLLGFANERLYGDVRILDEIPTSGYLPRIALNYFDKK